MFGRRNARETAQPGGDTDRLGVLAARYGFRRVDRIHIRTGDDARAATVLGVTHRYPRSIPVPLSVARRLVAAGAPVTVERAGRPARVTRV